MDFVFDNGTNGQKLKVLTLVDECTREAIALDVAGSIRAGRVAGVLERAVARLGAPRALRMDNGPEFLAKVLENWAEANGVELAHIEPGKRWQNCPNENFNGRLRDECLQVECQVRCVTVRSGSLVAATDRPVRGRPLRRESRASLLAATKRQDGHCPAGIVSLATPTSPLNADAIGVVPGLSVVWEVIATVQAAVILYWMVPDDGGAARAVETTARDRPLIGVALSDERAVR